MTCKHPVSLFAAIEMALKEKYTGRLTEALVLARTRASDLESVCKLNCWGSQIRDVSIVCEMPNLEVCSLSVNEISSLVDFSYCPNLQELYIRKNNIQNLSDIHHLKKLPKLRSLWLTENPCAEGENYRMTVLKTLPNLQKLDNIAVTEDELNEALERGENLELLSSRKPDTQSQDDSNPQEDETPQENGSTEENGVTEESITENTHSDSCVASSSQSVSAKQQDAVTLSWEETNRIREQLGLKPLPVTKMVSAKSNPTGHTRARNANILQSVLLLVRELDRDSLEEVLSAVKTRIESL